MGVRSAACTNWYVTYEQPTREGDTRLVGPDYVSWKTLEWLRGQKDVRVIEVKEAK